MDGTIVALLCFIGLLAEVLLIITYPLYGYRLCRLLMATSQKVPSEAAQLLQKQSYVDSLQRKHHRSKKVKAELKVLGDNCTKLEEDLYLQTTAI